VIERRRFIEVIAGGLFAAPFAAEAQPARKVARIGILSFSTPVTDMSGPEPRSPGVNALLRGLRELGRMYGRDFVTEPRGAKAIQRCGAAKPTSWFVSRWT